MGFKIEPWHEMVPWKYSDWMGWHEQGDGKLMLGVNIEQGRIRDTPTASVCARPHAAARPHNEGTKANRTLAKKIGGAKIAIEIYEVEFAV